MSASDCQSFPDGTSTPGEALTWTPGVPAGDAQHIELSSDPQGFENGHFVSSARLLPNDLGFSWRPTAVGQAYTWRVVTSSGKASSLSAAQTFVAAACVGGYSGP